MLPIHYNDVTVGQRCSARGANVGGARPGVRVVIRPVNCGVECYLILSYVSINRKIRASHCVVRDRSEAAVAVVHQIARLKATGGRDSRVAGSQSIVEAGGVMRDMIDYPSKP